MSSTAVTSEFPRTPLGESFDPLDAEGMMDFYERARAEEPIFYNSTLDMVIVTKYDDIHRVMHETETFSAVAALELIKPLSPDALQVAIDNRIRVDRMLVDQDPPEHTVKRRALRPPFHPKSVQEFVPDIERLIDERIERLVDRGEGDLVGDIMFEVPALVVFKLFGLPDSELETVRKFAKSNAKFGFGYPTDAEQLEDAKGIAEYQQWCESKVEELWEDLGDDVVSQFVKNLEDTDYPADKETATCLMLQLLFAGHETTANSSGNMFRFLLEHREQWEKVVANPDLVPNAVEECLRFASPVPQWRRRVVQDTELRGWHLPAGTTVMVSLASANQDEEHFGPDSTKLDVERHNAKEHMAFGWGRHRCLGEGLARQELQIALRKISQRLPHARLVEGQAFEYSPNTSHRGNEHVLVEWDPAQNPVAA